MSLKVSCTWGFGPDIILSSQGKPLLNLSPTDGFDKWKHGVQSHWNMTLTIEEAESLICDLEMAVRQIDSMEDSLEKCNEDLNQRETNEANEDGEEF